MKEFVAFTAAVAVCCMGVYALPALNPEVRELVVSPLENWSPESGINPDEMGYFFEGDMDVSEDFIRNGMVDEKFRWPNGIVPYVIEGEFEEKHIDKIYRAMETYYNVTNGCIQFIPQTNEEAYVRITSENSGCHSQVGHHKKSQKVNLDTHGCFSKIGIVLHELLHALGFEHEQSRWDRDEYVTINWEYIKESGLSAFKMSEEDYATGFGFPYDYGSVMHYSRKAFGNHGNETISPIDPATHIGQRNNLSEIDLGKLIKMYKCDEKQ